jgi:hypothetical protein
MEALGKTGKTLTGQMTFQRIWRNACPALVLAEEEVAVREAMLTISAGTEPQEEVGQS